MRQAPKFAELSKCRLRRHPHRGTGPICGAINPWSRARPAGGWAMSSSAWSRTSARPSAHSRLVTLSFRRFSGLTAAASFARRGLHSECLHGGRYGWDDVDGGQGEAVRVPPTPRRGDPVTAVGYPLGGPLTLSRGVALGTVLDRDLSIDVLRITARIEHGNSGGPLLDSHGRVVGVVYAIETRTGYGLCYTRRCDASAGRDWRSSRRASVRVELNGNWRAL
jgi:hypothetical protein